MLDIDDIVEEESYSDSIDELSLKLMEHSRFCLSCIEDTRRKLFVDHQVEGMPWKSKEAYQLFLSLNRILDVIPRI
jgi:hypothetical protein